MRRAGVLALLLCAGQDERILSILRHQNLLKELQDLALQGAKERSHQQKKHSSFEDELSEVLGKQDDQADVKEVPGEASPRDAAEKRGDSEEAKSGEDTDGARPQASPEPGQEPKVEDNQAPEEEEAANTPLPSQKHPGPQAKGDSEGLSQGLVDRETGLGAEQEQQAKRGEEEEDTEAGKKAVPEEEGPTAALKPHPSLGYKALRRGKSWSEALAEGGARKTGAEEAPRPEGKGQHSQQEQEERLSKQWEDAKRWSKMDRLAKELTADRRLVAEDEEDDPDRPMKPASRARADGSRGPGLQLRRDWRPSSLEDSVEGGLPLQVRSYPEEKKEEEGSANRRPEDQELESLLAIEGELEKVAHQLQALRQG